VRNRVPIDCRRPCRANGVLSLDIFMYLDQTILTRWIVRVRFRNAKLLQSFFYCFIGSRRFFGSLIGSLTLPNASVSYSVSMFFLPFTSDKLETEVCSEFPRSSGTPEIDSCSLDFVFDRETKRFLMASEAMTAMLGPSLMLQDSDSSETGSLTPAMWPLGFH
jgi:hypothetical protein